MKADGAKSTVWSWVDRPELVERLRSGRPGGFSRPWSVREQIIARAIGAEARRLRKVAGLSQDALGERLGITGPHVSYLEAGKRVLSVTLLWDLADGFHEAASHFIAVAEAEVGRFETPRPKPRPGRPATAPTK